MKFDLSEKERFVQYHNTYTDKYVLVDTKHYIEVASSKEKWKDVKMTWERPR